MKISKKAMVNKSKKKLVVINENILKDLLGQRYSDYIDNHGKPNMKLVGLLCNGDDYMQNKIRKAVAII